MTTPIDVWVQAGTSPVDVRCPNPRCRKLLHRIVSSDGGTIISDKCKCGTLVEVHVMANKPDQMHLHRASGRELKGDT